MVRQPRANPGPTPRANPPITPLALARPPRSADAPRRGRAARRLKPFDSKSWE
jgi:hypothetical protein